MVYAKHLPNTKKYFMKQDKNFVAQALAKVFNDNPKIFQNGMSQDQIERLVLEQMMQNEKVLPEDSSDVVMQKMMLRMKLTDNRKTLTKEGKVYDHLQKLFPNIKRNNIQDIIELSLKDSILKSLIEKMPDSDDNLETLMSKDEKLKDAFEVLVQTIKQSQSWVNTVISKSKSEGLQKG